jgi:phosphatidylethanolamine-binding protein (PEBP) family uncharacterized protein
VNDCGEGNGCSLTVCSPAFRGLVPARVHLRRRQPGSPPALEHAATGHRELAIEMPGPDAPGRHLHHWLVYRLPPRLTNLAAVPAGAAEGVNDVGPIGYRGPARRAAPRIATTSWCWPWTHGPGLAAGPTRSDLASRLSGHVLARGELAATYQRA